MYKADSHSRFPTADLRAFGMPQTPSFLNSVGYSASARYARPVVSSSAVASRPSPARSGNTHVIPLREVDVPSRVGASRARLQAPVVPERMRTTSWMELPRVSELSIEVPEVQVSAFARNGRSVSRTSAPSNPRVSPTRNEPRPSATTSRRSETTARPPRPQIVHARDFDEDAPQKAPEPQTMRLLEKARHGFRHMKAERSFSRIEGEGSASRTNRSSSSSVEGDGSTPRAGIYKAEMGRTHRRTTRMQESSGSAGGSGVLSHLPSFGGGMLRYGVIAAICLVLVFAFMYPVTKEFYVSQREHDRAAAEYAAVDQRNAEIQTRIDGLSTDSGIADKARSEYGWVNSGENAVSVDGAGTFSIDTQSASQSGAVVSGSIQAPETWYSPLLDAFFGYDG